MPDLGSPADAGGDQGVHPDDAACLSTEHQGDGGEEGIRAGIERAGPETPPASSSSLAMITTCDLKALSHPQLHPARIPAGSRSPPRWSARSASACGAAAASLEIAAWRSFQQQTSMARHG